GPARPDAVRRVRRGDRGALAPGDVGQESRSRDRRPGIPPACPTHERHRRVTSTSEGRTECEEPDQPAPRVTSTSEGRTGCEEPDQPAPRVTNTSEERTECEEPDEPAPRVTTTTEERTEGGMPDATADEPAAPAEQ